MNWSFFQNTLTKNLMLLLLFKVTLLVISPNYVIFVSRIMHPNRIITLQITYKSCSDDLNIYEKSELESVFLKTINRKRQISLLV